MLIAPVVWLVLGSFFRDGGFTIQNWIDTLTSRHEQQSIINTLALAVSSATVSTLIGGPAAWLISRMIPASRSFWLALLNVGANIGGIGLAFAFIATLGTFGMATLAVQSLGLPWKPPEPATFGGLLLGYEYTNIPLFVLLTIPAMGVVRDDWWEAAQVASATRLTFWRRVGLPVLAPFIAAGWLLIFTWSVGIYSLAYAFAGRGATEPFPLVTLTVGLTIEFDVFTTWKAYVLVVVLMAIAIMSLVTYRALLRRALKWF
jgi:putative spermidine/putrescine transport system permease protein